MAVTEEEQRVEEGREAGGPVVAELVVAARGEVAEAAVAMVESRGGGGEHAVLRQASRAALPVVGATAEAAMEEGTLEVADLEAEGVEAVVTAAAALVAVVELEAVVTAAAALVAVVEHVVGSVAAGR